MTWELYSNLWRPGRMTQDSRVQAKCILLRPMSRRNRWCFGQHRLQHPSRMSCDSRSLGALYGANNQFRRLRYCPRQYYLVKCSMSLVPNHDRYWISLRHYSTFHPDYRWNSTCRSGMPVKLQRKWGVGGGNAATEKMRSCLPAKASAK